MVPNVPGALRPRLFAAWLLKITRIVLRAYHNLLRSHSIQERSDIGRERRVPTLVGNRESAVDPYLGFEIHRPEIEHYASRRHALERELAAIPDNRMKARFADAGRSALRRKRNDDLPFKQVRPLEPFLGQANVLVIECEPPCAREIGPLAAAELGPGVAFGRMRATCALYRVYSTDLAGALA